MSKIVLHRAAERGVTNQGWLHSKHTFSFGDYYHQDRLHFGALRVINDDMIAPGRGFGNHPHSNMEIVTLPLDGELEHKDGNGDVMKFKPGDVQVLSAGDSVFHNLRNANTFRTARYLQLWFIPKVKGARTHVSMFHYPNIHNEPVALITPDLHGNTLWIYQDVWVYIVNADDNLNTEYKPKNHKKNGIYIFVIEGEIILFEQQLKAGDGIGVSELSEDECLQLLSKQKCSYLIIEVPMEI